MRGVPFITVLFMANNMLPLFLPAGWEPDRFLRPLVGIALFSAAYMAEEVRGGLQSLPGGPIRRRDGAGARLSRMMRLVVLPQALVLVIPGIVNNFIGLFKDTTLVAIVGINDFLAAMDNAIKGYGLERPDDPADRLRLRGVVLFRVLLCDVALFGEHGAAAGTGASALKGAETTG